MSNTSLVLINKVQGIGDGLCVRDCIISVGQRHRLKVSRDGRAGRLQRGIVGNK